ncbi:MAG: HsdR family type I site-specific deoxyribonuclease [Sphaerochaetaceae bacterium]|nr:HsdR family type I site-specific deoxyribonuclease [Sphaerochaetaceae bacterium]
MGDEDTTTEAMLIDALQNIGWTYVKPDELQSHREYSDVLNETDLVNSLIKLNPSIERNPQYADEVVSKLRAIISSSYGEGLVVANERFVSWMLNEQSMPFGKNGEHVTVRLIDYDNPENNQFIVSHQVMFPLHSKDGGKRFDIVLYINGMPVVVGECKTPTRPSISWADGALDIEDYERSDAASFFTPNVLNFATEGKFFRYGAIGMKAEMWGPWNYGCSSNEGTLKDVSRSVSSLFDKPMFIDIIKNYMLFANDDKYRRIKIVPRYQQVEGANAIVERVRAGHPKKGLIWHFQGSGKSLLMVFAAQKLRIDPELKNPTVIVIVDRVELDSQITGTFAVSGIPNTYNVDSISDLKTVLGGDMKKIFITTIHKFKDITPNLNSRDNIIVMVDEAHRTQYGNLGIQMRTGLPNAFFFGLTGTPINKTAKNTFDLFGSNEDEGGYLSKYSFTDSVRDHATLPLSFEPVNVKLHIDQDAIDKEFDAMTEDLDDEEKEALKKKASKLKTFITAPQRLTDVCAHIAEHFKTKVEPNGFKALVVTYDRECCVLYYRELLKYFSSENLQIVMHTASKNDDFKEFRLSKDEEIKIRDRFKDPRDPLKILIVTSRLITGFDAKILQTMYLDKPLKEHTLLQAVCRTNRVYTPNKTHGVIVDYLGLFDRVGSAFDYGDGKKVIINIDELRIQLPILVNRCLQYFDGIDKSKVEYKSLEQAQDRMRDVDLKDEFGKSYLSLHRVWEVLSPDPMLHEFISDYKWLSAVYISFKPTSPIGKIVWQSLGNKTIELIHNNIEVEIKDDLEAFVIDEVIIEQLIIDHGVEGASREVEIKLVTRLRKYSSEPEFISLGQKLEELRLAHELNQINSLDFLKDLLQLARDVLEAEQKIESMDEQERAKAALTELFTEVKNENTPIIVENIVNEIDGVVKEVRFAGWQDTIEGRRSVKKNLRKIIWIKYKVKDEEVVARAYSYIEMYYKC